MSAIKKSEPRRRREPIAPRILRATNEAPAYLSMSYEEFNRTVRPHVREIRIGERGVGFDRKELDAWTDNHVNQTAIEKTGALRQQSTRSERLVGETQWREKQSPASRRGTGSGISTKKSTEKEFTRVLALVKGQKPKRT